MSGRFITFLTDFDATDRMVVIGFLALLAVVTFLSFTGRTELWVPQLLIDLAG